MASMTITAHYVCPKCGNDIFKPVGAAHIRCCGCLKVSTYDECRKPLGDVKSQKSEAAQ